MLVNKWETAFCKHLQDLPQYGTLSASQNTVDWSLDPTDRNSQDDNDKCTTLIALQKNLYDGQGHLLIPSHITNCLCCMTEWALTVVQILIRMLHRHSIRELWTKNSDIYFSIILLHLEQKLSMILRFKNTHTSGRQPKNRWLKFSSCWLVLSLLYCFLHNSLRNSLLKWILQRVSFLNNREKIC